MEINRCIGKTSPRILILIYKVLFEICYQKRNKKWYLYPQSALKQAHEFRYFLPLLALFKKQSHNRAILSRNSLIITSDTRAVNGTVSQNMSKSKVYLLILWCSIRSIWWHSYIKTLNLFFIWICNIENFKWFFKLQEFLQTFLKDGL